MRDLEGGFVEVCLDLDGTVVGVIVVEGEGRVRNQVLEY